MIPDFGTVDREYFDRATRDFPATFREDTQMMNHVGNLFDRDLQGDEWHITRDAMERYIWDEYELVMDDFFHWEDYGEWYEATH